MQRKFFLAHKQRSYNFSTSNLFGGLGYASPTPLPLMSLANEPSKKGKETGGQWLGGDWLTSWGDVISPIKILGVMYCAGGRRSVVGYKSNCFGASGRGIKGGKEQVGGGWRCDEDEKGIPSFTPTYPPPPKQQNQPPPPFPSPLRVPRRPPGRRCGWRSPGASFAPPTSSSETGLRSHSWLWRKSRRGRHPDVKRGGAGGAVDRIE